MKYLTTPEQLKLANSSIAIDFQIASIESFINLVEIELLQLIGETTLDKILTDPIAINILRRAITDLSLAQYTNSGSVLLGNSGIYVSKSDRTLPASDKKLLNFKTEALERGWNYVEQLVVYLESKSVEYNEWKDSEERKSYFSTLFGNSTEFTSFGGLSISAHLFKVLKPIIQRVEEDYLNLNFGESFVENLRTKRLSDDMTPALKKLERKFMQIVAPLALAEAIPLNLVSIKEGGVYQSSVVALGNSSDNVQAFTSAEINKLSMVMGKLDSEGIARLTQVKKWLKENVNDYPEHRVPTEISREALNTTDSNIYLL